MYSKVRTHTHTEAHKGSYLKESYLGKKDSRPDRRNEPGRNKARKAERVRALEESCCSRLLLDFICDPEQPVHAHCPLPLLLYLLYTPSRGYADQCPLNLSSASVCAKIIGDSPPAASGANIRSLLLWGGGAFCFLHRSCRKTCEEQPSQLLQEIQMGMCMCELCTCAIGDNLSAYPWVSHGHY